MIYGNYMVDTDFKKFLDHMKQKYGIVQSRLITIAILEKYKDEYAEFLKEYEKRVENHEKNRE